MNLSFLLLLATAPGALAQGGTPADQDAPNPALLPVALKKLAAMKDPIIVANRDTLKAVLERYYTDRASMKSSEFQLLQAFEEADPDGRGTTADRLALMLKAKGAAPAPPAPPAPRPAAPHATPRPRPTPPRPAPPAHKSALAFTASTHRAPGGGSVGVVELRNKGQRTVLVEIYSGGSIGVGERAKVIATRFGRLDAQDPLWWMKLKVGSFRNEVIVSSPRAENGIVVTADRPFAEACSTDPKGLARLLVRKIRDGIEPTEGGRGADDAEGDLIDAIDARQRGDEVAATDPKAAEAAYAEAIKTSPTYVVAYLRLAALRKEKGDSAGARSALQEGLAVAGMSDAAKAQLKAQLDKL